MPPGNKGNALSTTQFGNGTPISSTPSTPIKRKVARSMATVV
jgi:hypothetical protein